jgi:hypothetical protein
MICGAEARKLGAMIHGAELRVHFLKSFQKGSTCENLLQKGLKIKKVGWAASLGGREKKAAGRISPLGRRKGCEQYPFMICCTNFRSIFYEI